jgi:anti-sigma B factor antagonist
MSSQADRRAGGPLSVTVTRPAAETTLISVVGEVDMATVALLRPALEPGPVMTRRVVVDLSRVEFLSATALEELHRAARRLQVDLVVATHQVLRTLEATGAAELFTVFPTASAALTAGDAEPVEPGHAR